MRVRNRWLDKWHIWILSLLLLIAVAFYPLAKAWTASESGTPGAGDDSPPKRKESFDTALVRKPSSNDELDTSGSEIDPNQPALLSSGEGLQKQYSLQVATCRMKSCVDNLAEKLRKKGFQPVVSHIAFSTPAKTEVVLGEFPTEKAALSRVALAEKKKIETTTIKKEDKWRVSAGRYVDGKEAARRLDELKADGLSGNLVSSPGTSRPGLWVVRTGDGLSQMAATALRKHVVDAGFSGSFIVRQKPRKVQVADAGKAILRNTGQGMAIQTKRAIQENSNQSSQNLGNEQPDAAEFVPKKSGKKNVESIRMDRASANQPVKTASIGTVRIPAQKVAPKGALNVAEKKVDAQKIADTTDKTSSKEKKPSKSRLSDKVVPFHSSDKVPERPPLLLEIGDPFLHQGNLAPGFEIPGGAVWQPRLWIFGTLRTAFQSFDNGVDPGITELATRFDLFANLQLTGTEKIVAGIRPLDRNRFTEFTRYVFSPENSFRDETNVDLRTLYFEGDIGSLFPFLDPKGTKPIDYGFSIGRQPIIFQDGILINDTIDAVGVVRNNIYLPGVTSLRTTFIYGWGELDSNRPDPDAQLFGLFLAADTFRSTIEVDGIYVKDDGPGNDGSFHVGAASTQRFGHLNTTFRANASIAEDRETAGVGTGVLLSAELSWTPTGTDDNLYFNTFWAIDNFTQAGREPVVGGPLATFGILFASVSLGNYVAELSGRAEEVAGYALGYQWFLDPQHTANIVFETAARFDTSGKGNDDFGFGIQFQKKFGRRILWQIDGFYAIQENRDNAFGGRTEVLYQF